MNRYVALSLLLCALCVHISGCANTPPKPQMLPLNPTLERSAASVPDGFMLASVSLDKLDARALDAVFRGIFDEDAYAADSVSWILRGFWNLDKTPTLSGIDVTRPILVSAWIPPSNTLDSSAPSYGYISAFDTLPPCVGMTVILPAHNLEEAQNTAQEWISTFFTNAPQEKTKPHAPFPPDTTHIVAGTQPFVLVRAHDHIRVETCKPLRMPRAGEDFRATLYNALQERAVPKPSKRVITPALRHFLSGQGALRVHMHQDALRQFALFMYMHEIQSALSYASPSSYHRLRNHAFADLIKSALAMHPTHQHTTDTAFVLSLTDTLEIQRTETLTEHGRTLLQAGRDNAKATWRSAIPEAGFTLESAFSCAHYAQHNPKPDTIRIRPNFGLPFEVFRNFEHEYGELGLLYTMLDSPLSWLMWADREDVLNIESASIVVQEVLPYVSNGAFAMTLPLPISAGVIVQPKKSENFLVEFVPEKTMISTHRDEGPQRTYTFANRTEASTLLLLDNPVPDAERPLFQATLQPQHLLRDTEVRKLLPERLAHLTSNVRRVDLRVDLHTSTLLTTLRVVPSSAPVTIDPLSPLLVAGEIPRQPPISPGFACLHSHMSSAQDHYEAISQAPPQAALARLDTTHAMRDDKDLQCALNDPASAPLARAIQQAHLHILGQEAYAPFGPAYAQSIFHEACTLGAQEACTYAQLIPDAWTQTAPQLIALQAPPKDQNNYDTTLLVTPSTTVLDRTGPHIQTAGLYAFHDVPSRVLPALGTNPQTVSNALSPIVKEDLHILSRDAQDATEALPDRFVSLTYNTPLHTITLAADHTTRLTTIAHTVAFFARHSTRVQLAVRNEKNHILRQTLSAPRVDTKSPSSENAPQAPDEETDQPPLDLYINVSSNALQISYLDRSGEPQKQPIASHDFRKALQDHSARIGAEPFTVHVAPLSGSLSIGALKPLLQLLQTSPQLADQLVVHATPQRVSKPEAEAAGELSSVLGALSKEDIKKSLSHNTKSYRSCYERALIKNPQMSGTPTTVIVRFVIGMQGKVISASTRDTTAEMRSLETCLLRTVKRTVFPKPKGGGVVQVTYPFVFSTK